MGKSVLATVAACLATGSCTAKSTVTAPNADAVQACLEAGIDYSGTISYGRAYQSESGPNYRDDLFGLVFRAQDGRLDMNIPFLDRSGGTMFLPGSYSPEMDRDLIEKTGAPDAQQAREQFFVKMMKDCLLPHKGKSTGPA